MVYKREMFSKKKSSSTLGKSGKENFLTDEYRLEDLDIGETLGTGTFGRVRLVRHKQTGKYFALKILKKAEVIRLKQVEHIMSEKAILASLKHPFIVRLFQTFQDQKNLYMLLEYVIGGELFSHLRKVCI